MNKFTKAGIAGAAALAIAAGGGTYALWTDYVVDSGARWAPTTGQHPARSPNAGKFSSTS